MSEAFTIIPTRPKYIIIYRRGISNNGHQKNKGSLTIEEVIVEVSLKRNQLYEYIYILSSSVGSFLVILHLVHSQFLLSYIT